MTQEEKMNQILSNELYINWLKEYMLNKEFISIFDCIDDLKVISEEDKLKISDLFLFYRGIEKYAEDNNILPYQVNPSSYSECTFYLISFNDFCFQIGITSGLGNMIYCKKTPRKLDTINFYDIMYNYKKIYEKKYIKKVD